MVLTKKGEGSSSVGPDQRKKQLEEQKITPACSLDQQNPAAVQHSSFLVSVRDSSVVEDVVNSIVQQTNDEIVPVVGAVPVVVSSSAPLSAQDSIFNLVMFSSKHQDELRSMMITEAEFVVHTCKHTNEMLNHRSPIQHK